jgi:prepilin-type processing-associated H-X9-DG protein
VVGRFEHEFTFPADTVMFADCGELANANEPNPDRWVEKTGGSWIYFRTPSDEWYSAHPSRAVSRHQGKVAAGFLDGHAASVENSSLGWHYPERDPRARWDRY